MNYLNKLLIIADRNRSTSEIIYWWELRRLLYNFVVLLSGLLSLAIISPLINVPPGEDVVEPLAVIAFAVVCNLSYTLGWLTEIFIGKSSTYGPKMFRAGLYFTLIIVFIPTVVHVISWILRGFTTMY